MSKHIRLKSCVAICMICSCLTMTSSTVLASPLQLQVDGSMLKTSTEPVIKNGTTMVPIRVVSENLGASVFVDGKDITVTKGTKTIKLTIGSNTANVNSRTIIVDEKPYVVNGSIMVPARIVSEGLGCTINYDKKSGVVKVTTSGSSSSAENTATGSVTTSSGDNIKTESQETSSGETLNYMDGIKTRTTNLPSNAKYFPFIQEGVPNWCYEQQPYNDNYFGPYFTDENSPVRYLATQPRTIFAGNCTSESMKTFWEDNYEHLYKAIEQQLTIDYRTVNDEEFISAMVNGIHPKSVVEPVSTIAKDYLAFVRKRNLAFNTEFKILPETVWQAGRDLPNQCEFSVYVKVTPTSGMEKRLKFIGNVDAISKESIPQSLQIGKTYEAVITYTATYDSSSDSYKLNYMNMAPTAQIDPMMDMTGGVCPSQKQASTNNTERHYNWAPEGVYYTRYEKGVRKG